MHKTLAVAACAALMISLTACGAAGSVTATETTPSPSSTVSTVPGVGATPPTLDPSAFGCTPGQTYDTTLGCMDPVTAEPSETVTPEETTEAPVAPEYTVSQQQAIEAAESYLDSGSFSKYGLMNQLTSEYGEGFSKADAAFALKHITADWNAEAREAAASYLETGHFSHNGLMQQLTSKYGEGFTKAQAAQAVKSVGL